MFKVFFICRSHLSAPSKFSSIELQKVASFIPQQNVHGKNVVLFLAMISFKICFVYVSMKNRSEVDSS